MSQIKFYNWKIFRARNALFYRNIFIVLISKYWIEIGTSDFPV